MRGLLALSIQLSCRPRVLLEILLVTPILSAQRWLTLSRPLVCLGVPCAEVWMWRWGTQDGGLKWERGSRAGQRVSGKRTVSDSVQVAPLYHLAVQLIFALT
eukprot:1009790-Prorocentrum_minimum.AAC.1